MCSRHFGWHEVGMKRRALVLYLSLKWDKYHRPRPALVRMNGPSQHLNPTSVEICVDEKRIRLCQSHKLGDIYTVVELHMTATSAWVSVVANMFLAMTLTAIVNDPVTFVEVMRWIVCILLTSTGMKIKNCHFFPCGSWNKIPWNGLLMNDTDKFEI